MNNKIEDITDIINDLKSRYTPSHFKKMKIKVGKMLSFNYEGSPIVLKITKITKDGHYLAEHIKVYKQIVVSSHYGHAVDSTVNPPFCTDCNCPVTVLATKEGKIKYELRKERTLSDGTPINEI